jgi:hypothetical protein
VAGDVEDVDREPVVVDGAVAEAVAAEMGGGMKVPVERLDSGQRRRTRD